MDESKPSVSIRIRPLQLSTKIPLPRCSMLPRSVLSPLSLDLYSSHTNTGHADTRTSLAQPTATTPTPPDIRKPTHSLACDPVRSKPRMISTFEGWSYRRKSHLEVAPLHREREVADIDPILLDAPLACLLCRDVPADLPLVRVAVPSPTSAAEAAPTGCVAPLWSGIASVRRSRGLLVVSVPRPLAPVVPVPRP